MKCYVIAKKRSDRVEFPLMRKIVANTLSNDLVEIKPMNAPVGSFFYWRPTVDYTYPENKVLHYVLQ
jgi:hypothetical protein